MRRRSGDEKALPVRLRTGNACASLPAHASRLSYGCPLSPAVSSRTLSTTSSFTSTVNVPNSPAISLAIEGKSGCPGALPPGAVHPAHARQAIAAGTANGILTRWFPPCNGFLLQIESARGGRPVSASDRRG